MRAIPLRLFRYLAKEFSIWFVSMLLVLFALIFLLEFSELLRRAQGIEEATYPILTEMAFLKLPHMAEELLPFALFFSAILCLWRLNRNSELTIIRSMGVSVWQFLMPIALVSLLIGSVDLFLINPITSIMKQRYDQLDSKHLRQKHYSLKVSESGVWIRQVHASGSTIYKIGRVNMKQAAFFDISLYHYDFNNKFISRMDAKRGWLIEDKLHLEKVWIAEANQLPKSINTLIIPSKLTLQKLTETNISPDSMSFWELSKFIHLLEKSGLLRDEYKLYWHAQIARIFWLVSMIFLAAACVLHSIRQGKIALYIFMGVIAGFGLYVLKDVTYVMGAASTIPAMLAAWIPAIVTFTTGLSVLVYFEDG